MDFRTPCTLAEKIAALKAARSPVHIATFLTIYLKAEQECSVNYMEGAQALYNWLINGSDVVHSVDTCELRKRVPSMLLSYSTVQLAKIFSKYEDNWNVKELSNWNRIIARTAMRLTLI